MTLKPQAVPRCDCGQVTEWSHDEDYDRWYRTRCWRCLEIESMKNPDDAILRNLLPWDEDMKDRFIEIMADTSVLLKRMTVIPYKGKADFPGPGFRR